MKKPFFWFTLLAPISLFGQEPGYVNFANTAATLFTTNGSIVGQGIGNMSGANQWRIGLYVAPDGTTLESAFTLVAVATNSTIAPGRFSFRATRFILRATTANPSPSRSKRGRCLLAQVTRRSLRPPARVAFFQDRRSIQAGRPLVE